MTHEQFITFETAKLAKQAGFNWGVRGYYTDDGDLSVAISEYDHNMQGYFSAPTQAVLQRWLREEKTIHISITWVLNAEKHYEWLIEGKEVKGGFEYNYENTYEESLEAGLQKCLNLIIEK